VLTHNVIGWSARLGATIERDDQLTVAKTFRTRLLVVPARVVRPAGQPRLRLPARWPWAATFLTALAARGTETVDAKEA
jgi:hypothetical protein